MITGIDFVSLPVADMARAKAFYQELLGLAPDPSGDGGWVEFNLGDGPALALVDAAFYGLPFEPVPGTGSVALAASDFEGKTEALRAQGRLKQAPFESPVCHGAFGEDTEGNAFALHRRKGEPDRDRAVDFVGLPVADMARARAFYEGVLGLVPATTSGEVWTEYVLADDSALALGDVRVMGLEFVPVTGGSAGLRTPEFEALFERLEALGHVTAERVLETKVCHMGFVRDSEGNSLVLHRPKPGR